MSDALALAITVEGIVGEAGRLAQRRRTETEYRVKPDGSIVTPADQETEEFLRKQLGSLVPGAAFWGEESTFEPPTEAGQWVVDPIDGTSNYAFGQPLWGLSVGFLRGGRIELGVIVLPDLHESYRAAHEHGSYRNGERMPALAPGVISPEELVGAPPDLAQTTPGKDRHLGAFVVEAMFVATGRLRAMIAKKALLYDCAASVIINREVGAEARHLDGRPWNEAVYQAAKRCAPFAILPPDSGLFLRTKA